MTEVIYTIRYFNPIRKSREQIEKEINDAIDGVLKHNHDVIGYDITQFCVDEK